MKVGDKYVYTGEAHSFKVGDKYVYIGEAHRLIDRHKSRRPILTIARPIDRSKMQYALVSDECGIFFYVDASKLRPAHYYFLDEEDIIKLEKLNERKL